MGRDNAFKGNGKVEEKTFMLPVLGKPTLGGLPFYLIMNCVAGGIKGNDSGMILASK